MALLPASISAKLRFALSENTKSLLSGSIWSFALQAISKVSVLASTVVGARLLGVEAFGFFIALQGIMLLAVSLWDFGFTPMSIRNIAAGEVSIQQTLKIAAATRLRLVAVPIIVLVSGAMSIGIESKQAMISICLFALAAAFNGASSILSGVLKARLEFRQSTFAMSIGRVGFLIAIGLLWFVRPSATLVWMTVVFALAELMTVIALLIVLRPQLLSTDTLNAGLTGHSESLWQILKKSSPYAISGLFILVYNRLDVAIVAMVADKEQAGFYAPASRIQDAMLIFPMTATAALVPVAARQYGLHKKQESVTHLTRYSIGLSLLLSLPAALIVVLSAHLTTQLLLGDDFQGSVEPIRILALSIPFIAVGTPVMSTLTALGRPRLATIMIALGFLVAVIGTVILAPRWGAIGASWAAMLREPVIALAGLILLYRIRDPQDAAVVIKGT